MSCTYTNERCLTSNLKPQIWNPTSNSKLKPQNLKNPQSIVLNFRTTHFQITDTFQTHHMLLSNKENPIIIIFSRNSSVKTWKMCWSQLVCDASELQLFKVKLLKWRRISCCQTDQLRELAAQLIQELREFQLVQELLELPSWSRNWEGTWIIVNRAGQLENAGTRESLRTWSSWLKENP